MILAKGYFHGIPIQQSHVWPCAAALAGMNIVEIRPKFKKIIGQE